MLQETVELRANPAPRFNGAGGNLPAPGGRVPVMLVSLTNCSSSSGLGTRIGDTCTHGVSHGGINKKLSCQVGVCSYNIHDGTFKFKSFMKRQVSRGSGFTHKLRDDQLIGSVQTYFPAK